MKLARFERHDGLGLGRHGLELGHLHFMWVLGPAGALVCWASDTRAIIGHSVVDAPTFHSPRPLGTDGTITPEQERHCAWLEAPCRWGQVAGGLTTQRDWTPIYDEHGVEAIWPMLESLYEVVLLEAEYA